MCPTCLSKQVRRSHFRLRDLPLLLLHAKPSRCMTCFRRFYEWPWFRNLIACGYSDLTRTNPLQRVHNAAASDTIRAETGLVTIVSEQLIPAPSGLEQRRKASLCRLSRFRNSAETRSKNPRSAPIIGASASAFSSLRTTRSPL